MLTALEETGDFFVGLSLPAELTAAAARGEQVELNAYYAPGVPAEAKQIFHDVLVLYANTVNPETLASLARYNDTKVVLGNDMTGAPLSMRDRFAPLLLMMIVVIEVFGLATLLNRDIDNGTARALVTGPLRLHQFFVGKALMGLVLAFGQVLLLSAVMGILGTAPLLLLTTLLLGSLLMVGLGFFIAAISKDSTSVMGWTIVFIIPMVFPGFSVLLPRPLYRLDGAHPFLFLCGFSAPHHQLRRRLGRGGRQPGSSAPGWRRFDGGRNGSHIKEILMDIKRIAVLIGKDARLGAANFMIVYVLVMPVIISLLIALVFGDLLAQTPRLGIYDPGASEQFTRPLLDHPSINTTVYDSDAALQSAVERGSEEVGLSLPAGFAAALESDSAEVDYTFYRWGEAGVRNLLLLDSVVARAMTEGIGTSIEQLPVSVNVEQIGSANTLTWSQRLLPLLLIMSIVLGGLFFPAASLLDEKKESHGWSL